MNLLTTFKGSMMEGFLPAGWDLAKIDACCSHPANVRHRTPAVLARAVRARRLRHARGLRRDDGPRDRHGDPPDPRGGPRAGDDPAGRPDGDVPLGRLLPEGVGRLRRPRPRLQHGRVVRRPGQHPARRRPRRLPERDAGGLLRPARQPDRPGRPPLVRHPRPPPRVRRPHRRPEEERRRAGRRLRDRPRLPHRLLGAPLRRRVRATSTSGRPRPTASAPGSTR